MIIFENDYELPAYTVGVAEAMESAAKATGIKDAAKARFEFLRTVLGKDAAAEVCGGATVATVDISRVNVAFMLVQREYLRPTLEAQREEMEQQTEMLKQMAEAVRAITEAAKAPELSRQGFRAVK